MCCRTDGVSWSVIHHHWKSEAKGDHQLGPSGPSKIRIGPEKIDHFCSSIDISLLHWCDMVERPSAKGSHVVCYKKCCCHVCYCMMMFYYIFSILLFETLSKYISTFIQIQLV